jgi:hypothetical protein
VKHDIRTRPRSGGHRLGRPLLGDAA